MKVSFSKFLLLVGGVLVVLFSILSALGSIAPPDMLSSPDAGLTMAKYSAIGTGMSYREVVAIIDSPREEMSRSDIAGTTTVMYSWKNRNGTNMNAMFQDGRLVSKAQFALQ